MKRLLIIALFVCVCLLLVHSKGLCENYLSCVGFSGTLEGRVNHHFSMKIEYWIGWTPTTSGTAVITNSYMKDPEYILFGSSLPPGLTFDSNTGYIEGIPTVPGKWILYPAVRCKQRGDNVYRGNGMWLTSYTTYEGKIWTKSKEPITINIQE